MRTTASKKRHTSRDAQPAGKSIETNAVASLVQKLKSEPVQAAKLRNSGKLGFSKSSWSKNC